MFGRALATETHARRPSARFVLPSSHSAGPIVGEVAIAIRVDEKAVLLRRGVHRGSPQSLLAIPSGPIFSVP